MEDIQTRENDLIFEVTMAPQDHAEIVNRMSELLNKITLAGTIFFFALCLIMSFIVWFLSEDVSKSNSIIMQGNAEIIALKQEEKDLNSIISNQKRNTKKLTSVSSYLIKPKP